MTFRTEHSGAPVLDLGDGIGALLVRLTTMPSSGELHAQPAGDPEKRFHTGVHVRRIGGELAPCALFPEVAEGAYEVLDETGCRIVQVEVVSGSVAEIACFSGAQPDASAATPMSSVPPGGR